MVVFPLKIRLKKTIRPASETVFFRIWYFKNLLNLCLSVKKVKWWTPGKSNWVREKMKMRLYSCRYLLWKHEKYRARLDLEMTMDKRWSREDHRHKLHSIVSIMKWLARSRINRCSYLLPKHFLSSFYIVALAIDLWTNCVKPSWSA